MRTFGLEEDRSADQFRSQYIANVQVRPGARSATKDTAVAYIVSAHSHSLTPPALEVFNFADLS